MKENTPQETTPFKKTVVICGRPRVSEVAPDFTPLVSVYSRLDSPLSKLKGSDSKHTI